MARHGARRIELDVLPQDDAEVLIRRLTDPRLTDEPGATAALATQCARLPLALRLAAEMTDSRPGAPLTELVQELADQRHRLDLLDAGGDRRTGVRAVLSWPSATDPITCRTCQRAQPRSIQLIDAALTRQDG